MKPHLLLAVFISFINNLAADPIQLAALQQSAVLQDSLPLRKTQTRTIAPREIHIWNLDLQAGQYVSVEIQQKGVDVIVNIIDPLGSRKAQFDSPLGSWGKEKTAWIAKTTGIWKLEIVSSESEKTMTYEISLLVQHEASERDRKSIEADSLNNLAQDFYTRGKYSEAELLYKKSLAIREKVLGMEDPETAQTISNLALIYYIFSKHVYADSLYQRALNIYIKALGPDNPEVSTTLNNLGLLYKTIGKYEQAETFYQRALAIVEKVFGPEHPDVATNLNNLASLYFTEGKPSVAESLYIRSLNIREKAFNSDHPDIAQTLNNLAFLYFSQGNYASAEPLYKRSLSIREKALGPDHPNVATALNNLAELYIEQGKYSEAETLYKRSLTIREKTLGRNHPSVATTQSNLATLYRLQGKYTEAEPLYKRALSIMEKALGSDHPQVARSLNNLAFLYYTQGRYAEAELLYQRSLSIEEKVFGPDHPDMGASLNNLALLYYTQGKYAQAEPLYKRSLAIWEKTLGPNHPSVATSLHNLAALYVEQGKNAEAESLYKQSLTIREKALELEHPDVAESLDKLAFLYYNQGNYAAAEALFKRSLAIREKTLGTQHPKVAESLNRLAAIASIKGLYIEADSIYKRSLDILEKALGPEHPDVAINLINQVRDVILKRGNGPKYSFPLIERAIRILDTTSAYPRWRVTAYSLRAILRKQSGDLKGALLDMTEALHSVEEQRPHIGGEEAQIKFFEQFVDYFAEMVAWQLEAGDLEKALEYAERGRARELLDQLAAGKIDLRQSIPVEIRASLEQKETDVKAHLAEYQQRVTLLRSRTDLSLEERNRQIVILQDSLRSADRDYQQIYEEIKNASPLWRDIITTSGQPVALATIQRSLVSSNSIMLFYQIGKDGSYLFIIPPADQKAEVIQLQVNDVAATILQIKPGPLKAVDIQQILVGEGSSVEPSSGFVQDISKFFLDDKPNQLAAKSIITKLHALWQILVPENLWLKLIKSSEVILIPDGALHLLPFDALIVQTGADWNDTRYWLDDGPAIRYAPSATTLYNIEQRPASRIISFSKESSVLSLSDPIYGPSRVDELRLSESQFRGSLGGGPLARLPGTARETKEIVKAFKSQGLVNTVLELKQRDANEANLRAALPGKRYIHLATHGLIDQQRSELFFAALALTPSSEKTYSTDNDGFLQLYEIYELKLFECELAVLSACHSNVGRKYDGSFALSRGFMAAGAQRVIASLWNVDDASTAELIGAFFRQIAGNEKTNQRIDFASTLRDAKRIIRSQKKWASPYFWAPFILTGKR